jgi:hypothetical protein
MDGLGLGFHNLWNDPGPSFGHSLIILFFDNFLYAILAYYLDLVIPGDVLETLAIVNDGLYNNTFLL